MALAKKENFQSRDPLIAIVISVILASVFMVYPVSYFLSGWRPTFMLLIMLFWVLCQPAWCGVWFAFLVGIFTDLLMEYPLGLNALSFVLIAFFTRYLTRERRVMTQNNLWVITSISIGFHLLLLWLLLVMTDNAIGFIRHWQALLSSVLIWPVVYWGLKKWRAV